MSVEFAPYVCLKTDLVFSAEVHLMGDKIGNNLVVRFEVDHYEWTQSGLRASYRPPHSWTWLGDKSPCRD